MEFHILGPVEVVHEGRTLSLGRSRERAVLALLLLSANRVVSVERLVDDLWAGEPPEGATQALRVFVSRLRKALREAGGDGLIVTEPAGYVARVEAGALDADRFDALVAAGREQARRGDHHRAAATLREALLLWRGPALADVADSPGARSEAARLEESRLAALGESIEAELACGRHGELVAELDALTRAHPLQERFWGQRMVALYRSGRQADALRAYQELRAILGEELGLEPSAAVSRLEGAILRHEPELEWPGADTGAPRPEAEGIASLFAERTPYVGRDAERAELGRLLDAALRGHGGLVLIGGEPGVGKTRLGAQVGDEATRRGMAVRVGRCYEIEGAPPYVPFVEILEQSLALAPSPEAFRELLGEDAAEVAKLLPRLRRLFPDIPPPLELPPEQERRYLFNSIREFVARAAAAHPLFLVLDDLHWADESTLFLLEHLAERLPEMPVLAVGTYRDTETTAGHPLARALDGLFRRRLSHRLGLRRLPEEGVAGMLAAMSGQEPPPALVKAIHAETEGNPFFVEEMFKHLAEEGRLFGRDGRLYPEVAIAEIDLPETVRIVLGRRLERLGDGAHRALTAAAVVGRAFTFELLEALGELDPDALLSALDEAERARLVAPVSERADDDRLLFAHELIRQTLLSELSQPRRRRLHLRVAEVMEQLYEDSLEDQASEIAHHLVQAGAAADHRKLLAYLILAGRRALATAGFEEALRHFERAVSLRDVAEPRQLADLLVDLGMARISLGLTAEALATWQEALQAHEALGATERMAEVCFKASQVLWWVNRDEEGFALAQRGMVALGDRATPQRVRLLAWAGAAVAFVTPYEVGAEMIDEALALAAQLGDERLLGHALANKALHRFPNSAHREVVEAGLQAATLLRSAGDLWDAATVLGVVEVALVLLGRMEQAAQVGEEVTELAERLGHPFALWIDNRARGPREFASAPDLDRFEASARRDLEMPGHEAASHGWLGIIEFLRGDWDAALRLAEEGTRHEPTNSLSGWEWGPYFQILAYREERAEALAVLARKREALPGSKQANGMGSWHLLLSVVEGLYVLGEREEAAALYPRVVELADLGVVFDLFCGRLVERVAGTAAAAGGRWEAAEVHFLTALRQAEEMPHRLEQAETRRFYAQMLFERAAPGDAEQARVLLAEAIEAYCRICMPKHEDMARALLRQRR